MRASVADLDGDGDLDVLVGNDLGNFFYFENQDSQNGAGTAFAAATSNPFGLADVGTFSTPAIGNLNDTGDADVLAGSGSGNFYLFSDSFLTVELVVFTATRDLEAALLRWETASETDNAGFEVHRLLGEGGAFVPLGFVAGHGTSAEAHRYSFRTEALSPGTHRFCLRQADLDDTQTYSATVG